MKITLPIVFALLTALFWGMYGPALGKSRGAEGSAFKPYLMIGLAYLVWGVVGGYIGMWYNKDTLSFSGVGATWGFIAGTLGAWGAFTLTLAMFTGGARQPHVVMPVVFGGAVAVSAIVSLLFVYLATRQLPQTNLWLWVGIVGMAICVVLIAYNTPHGGPAHKEKSGGDHHKQAQAAPLPQEASTQEHVQ